jgi:long-chain acyl-CoA synthetase
MWRGNPSMQVEDFLEISARRDPGKIALICGSVRRTYRQLDEVADRVAHALIEAGLGRLDRVTICLENSVEAVVSIFAVLKAGGVFVLVNPHTKPHKLSDLLSDSGAAALITVAPKVHALRDAWSDLPRLQTVLVVGQSAVDLSREGRRSMLFRGVLESHSGADGPPAKRNIDIDLAAMMYTSGSTGRP